EEEVEEVVVYDIFGRRQVTETPSHQGGLTIDVTNLNNGIYFVKVVTEKGEAVQRFVKK
ncbi:MAG: T9SS type A sorting domain-containing protein, partial [Bacteroidales bacterium]|nr:T9SS type A sorting domain-containing protein [Bacteroidales bacterium]